MEDNIIGLALTKAKQEHRLQFRHSRRFQRPMFEKTILQPWPAESVRGIKRKYTSQSRGSRVYKSSRRPMKLQRPSSNSMFEMESDVKTSTNKPSQNLETPALDESSVGNKPLDNTMDQSLADSTILTESMGQSLIDDEPSEASFTRDLETQPRTAVSTPSKPGDSDRSVSDENSTISLPQPKRQLQLEAPLSPLALQGKVILLFQQKGLTPWLAQARLCVNLSIGSPFMHCDGEHLWHSNFGLSRMVNDLIGSERGSNCNALLA